MRGGHDRLRRGLERMPSTWILELLQLHIKTQNITLHVPEIVTQDPTYERNRMGQRHPNRFVIFRLTHCRRHHVLSLGKNAPDCWRPQKLGLIASISILGGLHHQ
jgi:hypothetical protein